PASKAVGLDEAPLDPPIHLPSRYLSHDADSVLKGEEEEVDLVPRDRTRHYSVPGLGIFSGAGPGDLRARLVNHHREHIALHIEGPDALEPRDLGDEGRILRPRGRRIDRCQDQACDGDSRIHLISSITSSIN